MSPLHASIERHARGQLTLAEGEKLFHPGDTVERMHVVIRGEVVLERHSLSGVRLILQRAISGDIIAEPSIFADKYHCSALATSAATVIFAPTNAVRSAVMRDGAAMEQLARHFAREVQIARFRAEVLSLRRLSDRLDAWLELNGGIMPTKGLWLAVAADLAVTPEALYRELGRRRRQR